MVSDKKKKKERNVVFWRTWFVFGCQNLDSKYLYIIGELS